MDAALRALHEDSKGRLWIGTGQGLCCLENGKFTVFTGKGNLAGEVVRAICEDHSGILWFGTEIGLFKFQDGAFSKYTTAQGLSDNTVRALYEDKDRNLWVGTGKGGLNRFHDGKASLATKSWISWKIILGGCG